MCLKPRALFYVGCHAIFNHRHGLPVRTTEPAMSQANIRSQAMAFHQPLLPVFDDVHGLGKNSLPMMLSSCCSRSCYCSSFCCSRLKLFLFLVFALLLRPLPQAPTTTHQHKRKTNYPTTNRKVSTHSPIQTITVYFTPSLKQKNLTLSSILCPPPSP